MAVDGRFWGLAWLSSFDGGRSVLSAEGAMAASATRGGSSEHQFIFYQ